MNNENGLNERIFAVPYNGDADLVKRAVNENNCDYIHEFYGSDNSYASGRFRQIDPSQFEADIKLMLDNKIQFNYLLNAIVTDDYVLNIQPLENKLKRLQDIGVATLTVSHPILIKLIKLKRFSFNINCSVNNFVNSVERAIMLVNFGYNRITVDEDILRNIPLIRRISKACKTPVEVLINNGCIRGCTDRITHQAITSSIHPCIDIQEKIKVEEKLLIKCRGLQRSDFSIFLRANWIRPEDIWRYIDIGVNILKLSGRTFSTDGILQCLNIYSARKYSGNIIDYLKPDCDPLSRYGFSSLKSELVEDYFQHVWEDCEGDDCQKCKLLAKQISMLIDR